MSKDCPALDGLKDVTAEPLGPFTFMQKKGGQRVTGDSLLLADFVLPLNEDDRVIDLGSGTGIIPLVLAWKSSARKIAGVEVERGSAEVALRNVENNALQSRVEIIEKDYRELTGLYPEGAFSVVLSNPPYTRKGGGRVSPIKERALARSEVLGTHEDLLKVSAHLAGPYGRICLIYPVKRLVDVMDGLEKACLRPVRLRFVHTDPAKDAKLFLMEAARGGSLKVERPLFPG
jgi:tRNA1Val (adenine37-N6)-methyltransferase